MTDQTLFFILGAGASFDSGLPTYRGPSGLYNDDKLTEHPEDILSSNSPLNKVWNFIQPLYENIAKSSPGPTYELIKQLGKQCPNSFILTQNIDGHALSTELPVVEIHGSYKTMTCNKCRQQVTVNFDKLTCECSGLYRPDIVLYGERLPTKALDTVYGLIGRLPKTVIVIGTTLQFPYLRLLINKAKMRGAEVIHINPDDSYAANINKHEIWHKMTAEEGLNLVLSEYT